MTQDNGKDEKEKKARVQIGTLKTKLRFEKRFDPPQQLPAGNGQERPADNPGNGAVQDAEESAEPERSGKQDGANTEGQQKFLQSERFIPLPELQDGFPRGGADQKNQGQGKTNEKITSQNEEAGRRRESSSNGIVTEPAQRRDDKENRENDPDQERG